MRARGYLVLILLLLGEFLRVPALAQTKPPSLDQVLTALQAKYASVRTLSADFVQIYIAAGSPPRREEGTVLLARPRRMRWHYRQPEEKLFISDGTHVYLYVPAERQVIRAKIREAEDIKAAFAFLLGELNLRRLFARIERIHNPPPLQAGNLILRFIPKDTRLGFSELIAEISPTSLHVVRVSIRELDGARSDFLFSNIRENVPASRSAFALTIPPGVQILDAQ
ncbi:MAG: outer membrane lipoprotein carrier protein LolA [Blastocatellia bacterium]|nr:outer membrane lipoprotein carrier protein LolA [Blastocatellia bacterium]MCS7156745.1 outer membrane lipoprotein carrier protein LolA [Blastocatellia bacterium]MCX7751513.1 outer membrane lipoprotein carrier protein LolA [Blastocatellia bacterium]MDW8168613.1 outer membrane lipoprotein carrier protein LolA [Acidobacteriota bacterium]MDW8256578.1 outer membrane lipoprotein carrier protein LolA [Acidobacteriota bacterium]